MGNIKKILYFCLNLIIAGWSIVWLGIALGVGIFCLEGSITFGEWFLEAAVFIIVWILGLCVLFFIRRIIRGKNDFQRFKIKKRTILAGIFLLAFFVFVAPFLLTKIPSEYERHYRFIFLMAGILVFYVLFGRIFDKQINKMITGGDLQVLRGSTRLGKIFVGIIFFILIPLAYFGAELFKGKAFFYVYFIFLIIFAFFLYWGRNQREFNCPYCSKLLRINISEKPPEYLICYHCKNRIRFEPREKRERYLFILKKTKISCPYCKSTVTLPRIIKKGEVVCVNCGKKIPVRVIKYIAVKTSDNKG